MYDVLYLPCFDYFNFRQRPQHLLWELSKLGFNVIYCNVTQASPDYIPLSHTFNLCNNIKALNHNKEYIMWLTHGPYVELLPQFNLEMVISDFADASVDEFSEFAVYDEQKITAADLVFTASEKLFLDISKKHPRCFKVNNGVEFEHFAKSVTRSSQPPADIVKACSKPIVGFWGALSSWIDFALIEFIADIRSNYNFVFLGTFTTNVPRVPIKSNIFYLGPKDYEILPLYAQWFDVAIIPFQIKAVTLAANPIKAYEYIASGLPVVSTYLPQLEGLADIKLAITPEDFVSYLDWAVYNGKNQENIKLRMETAKQNTWEMRAVCIAEKIKEIILEP